MNTRLLLSVCLIVGLGGHAASAADPVAPTAVKFKDRQMAQSLTGKPGDAAKGRKWMINRKLGNCLACHKNSEMSEQLFHGEVGPPLDGASSRWTVPQLRAIVINSKKVFTPKSLMPAFYRAGDPSRTAKKFEGKTILKAQQIEDVVAYLAKLKDKK